MSQSPRLSLQLPEGGEQFDAAVFAQDGSFIRVGHREECEQAADAIGGLYCWIIDGRPVIRHDFEREPATIAETAAAALDHDGQTWTTADGESFDDLVARLGATVEYGIRTGAARDPFTGEVQGAEYEASRSPCSHISGDPVRYQFADGSALVTNGDAWDLEGDAPFSWAGA